MGEKDGTGELEVGHPSNHKGALMRFVGEGRLTWCRPEVTESGLVVEDSQCTGEVQTV